LWSHEDGEPISEIGWMVLPEFQGTRDRHDSGPRPASAGPRRRPLGTGARVPGHHQRPSNGICRSVGFRFAGEQDVPFAGRVIRASHWVINPGADLT